MQCIAHNETQYAVQITQNTMKSSKSTTEAVVIPVKTRNLVPLAGQKIRHSKLGWTVTVLDVSGPWVTAETGLGFQWTKAISHVRENYELSDAA